MNTAFVAICCSVVSGVVSWLVARYTAKAEIERLEATWAHERSAAFESCFAEMVGAVTYFVNHCDVGSFKDAVAKVAAVRSQATGGLANAVDELSSLLTLRGGDNRRIQAALTAVIDRKRVSGSH